jgi:hypothetical protein
LKDTDEDTRAASRNRVGKHDLKSADGEFVLPMGVYVEDGIGCADAAETRGALFTNAGDIDDFTVWAKHKVGENVSGYFNNVVFEKNTADNVFYSTGEEYMWPGDGNLTFVAVTNAPESGFVPNYTAGSDGEDMLESFTYTVPADATAQNDIVLAKATYSGDTDASAPLKFEHIMSAVNVTVGDVAKGEIKSIIFKGVYNTGTYQLSTNNWAIHTTNESNNLKTDYKVVFKEGSSFVVTGDEEEGSLINAAGATFMVLPQILPEGSVVEVVFNNGSRDLNLTATIAGNQWVQGKTTNYKVSIDENFVLNIVPTGKLLDAHYIVSEVNIVTEGLGENEEWIISVDADDLPLSGDASQTDVSVLLDSNVKYEFVKSKYYVADANGIMNEYEGGFWLDKVYYQDDNGNITGGTESARGTTYDTGKGNVITKAYVFIPENITGSERTITIKLQSKTNENARKEITLMQKSPRWVDGNFGWEVVDDSESGKYGFLWDRVVSYIYPYNSRNNTDNKDGKTRAEAREWLQSSFVDAYTAGNYATVVEYKVFDFLWQEYRFYITLDYSKLNNLGEMSEDNGLINTKTLFNSGGVAATFSLETAIVNTKKTESGDENGKAMFRKPGASEVSEYGIPAESGSIGEDLSGLLTYILKKNRYNVKVTSLGSSSTQEPFINESDILWYLPAVNQFDKFVPNAAILNDSKDDYWSSTAIKGAAYAYRGDKTSESRAEKLRVIAVRENVNNVAPTTIDVINAEEMAGGENGEAQWVE